MILAQYNSTFVIPIANSQTSYSRVLNASNYDLWDCTRGKTENVWIRYNCNLNPEGSKAAICQNNAWCKRA